MNNFKLQYGEVLTSLEGVSYLLNQLPSDCWSNPNITWFDIGSGVATPRVSYQLIVVSFLHTLLILCLPDDIFKSKLNIH